MKKSKMKNIILNSDEVANVNNKRARKKRRPRKQAELPIDENCFDWSRDFANNVAGKECVRRRVKGSNKTPNMEFEDNIIL